MIYIERKIVINNNEATIEEPIVLYRGDKNIEIQFTIENNPFKYKAGTAITYGQLVIIRPNAAAIIPEPAKLSNGRVLFTITDGMIDEDIEEGAYDFQIRMINADQTSRGTLPPVTGGIIIKEPLCEEATVNVASVNDNGAIVMPGNDMATYSMRNADNIFGENGDYNRTNWFGGDIITDTRLNKIEEALYQINNDIPTDYATEEYVDNQRRQTETYAERYTDNAIGRMNLDNYATHSYVDSEITKLDINKYATQEYVDDAVSNISGGGGNVDLTGYATEAYVDQALTNYPTHKEMKSAVKDMVTSSMSDMPDIMEMRGEFFASNYFTEDDYKDGLCKVVLFNDAIVDFSNRNGELVRMTLGWDKATSTRTITIDSILGYTEIYSVQADESLMIESRKTFATDDTINSILGKRNYATKDYVNEQIGDINAILDAINGEEV